MIGDGVSNADVKTILKSYLMQQDSTAAYTFAKPAIRIICKMLVQLDFVYRSESDYKLKELRKSFTDITPVSISINTNKNGIFMHNFSFII